MWHVQEFYDNAIWRLILRGSRADANSKITCGSEGINVQFGAKSTSPRLISNKVGQQGQAKQCFAK